MNQLIRKGAALSLILILGLGFFPTLSYANNGNGNGKGKGHNEREKQSQHLTNLGRHDNDDDNNKSDKSDRKDERNTNKLCRKAFKNLFKFRNLGNNSVNFYVECLRIVGFEATFTGQISSTTPDTTAPIITNLSTAPATTTAIITWHTNEKSNSTVFWSTSPGIDINSSSIPSASESAKIKNHNITITGLTASTTYYLIARSKDNAGNTGTSSEISFHTNIPIPVPPDVIPPVITNVATPVGTSTINVSWNTNEPATSKIFYSTSSDIDINATSTNFMENLTLTLNHLISLVGLLPQTVYHLMIRSVDGSGNATTTPLLTATTTSI
ncbi:MAG: hypothetical protein A3B03_00105 [Candidatus Zambryskibacteria bacterium RIFCSPLOWO2_01_FULL_42_41]|nr:MAG: hypothetical protein A2829_02340 [Candidatus Zambryskibacteria bacterium RIFCSPHIGHO2_01_FULL_43_60]OHB02806.1 MAG: hypothetical protein A3B03_00105 [Candidatus Zambryskibacteria bacterium RIFCSPLOWO2_01_FULL_42_41]